LLQGLFVEGRTASAYDLLAGAAGAAVGVLIVAIVAAVRKRSRRHAVATA
jgi:VanZ family protein